MPELPTFAQVLAALCFEAADLILKPSARPAEADADPMPPWAAERSTWRSERDTEVPMDWVAEATSAYLVEAAHQVRAIGVLLRGETVAMALDPLVRAVVERAGRVVWLLEPNVSPQQRGARAALELGVSLQAYREAVDRLGAPQATRRALREQVRAHRAVVEELFEVSRPPEDPCDTYSPSTPTFARWTVDRETYPGYSENATYAFRGPLAGGSRGQSIGAYGGLSGFSHPSVVFSREHLSIADGGLMTYTYEASDLEKLARAAAFSLLDAARYWTTYYGADPPALQRRIDELAETTNMVSVLGWERQDRAADPSDGEERGT